MIMINGPTDYLFKSTLGDETIVKHVNTFLNELYSMFQNNPDFQQYLQKRLTSHSVRAGSLNQASFHHEIMIQWLILRGGWSVDKMQTIFYYLAGASIHSHSLYFCL
jgi:hypothetical protein